MEKIFLDANVLLEILFRRTRYDKLVELLSKFEDVQFCISVLSLDIVMYFVESSKQSKSEARKFLDKYIALDLEEQDAEWAYDNDKGDFEDALQMSCARRHGCSQVITLDRKMGGNYGSHITILTVR